MKIKRIEKIEQNTTIVCQYCHEALAEYYIGKMRKPCCKDNPNRCPAVIKLSLEHGKATKKEKIWK